MDEKYILYRKDGCPVGDFPSRMAWYRRAYARWDEPTQEQPAGDVPQGKPVKIQYNIWTRLRMVIRGEYPK